MLLSRADLARLGDARVAADAVAQQGRLRSLFPEGDLPPGVLPRDDADARWPGTLPWAWALVRSRAFNAATVAVRYEGEAADPVAQGEATDRFAFVPFLDMANHDGADPSATFALVDDDHFELRALRALAVGDGAGNG